MAVALEYASADEAGDMGAEAGAVEDLGLPQPALRMPDADPVSQPKTEMVPPQKPAKPLILMPGQEGFSSAVVGKTNKVGTDEPLNVWKKPVKKLKSGAYQRLWQESISKLIDLVTQKMPETLFVTPDGTKLNLNIERLNIMADIPTGMVKAFYGLKGQSGSTKSTGAGKLGQQNSPDVLEGMRIDLTVSQNFCIEDETVNWKQRVADLVADAAKVFKPRPREIFNRTPPKPGQELSLRDAGAHVEETRDGHLIEIDSVKADEMAEFRKWKQQSSGVMPPAM